MGLSECLEVLRFGGEVRALCVKDFEEAELAVFETDGRCVVGRLRAWKYIRLESLHFVSNGGQPVVRLGDLAAQAHRNGLKLVLRLVFELQSLQQVALVAVKQGQGH